MKTCFTSLSILRVLAVSLALCSSVGLLAACGPGNSVHEQSLSRSDESDPNGDPNVIPPPEKIEAAANGHLFCSISGECDPAVVMVSIATNAGVTRCTGFMVSPNQIITNEHCFTKTYAAAHGCSGFAFVHAAAVGNLPEHNVGCSAIEFQSEIHGIGSSDYAVIRLNDSIQDRAPLKLSSRGFRSGEAAYVHRVQMRAENSIHSFDGVQTQVDCQNIRKSLFYPSADENSSVLTFAGCLIQHGNSGSPVLNVNGEVGAIIQGYVTPDQSDAQGMKLYQDLALDPNYEPLLLGTQSRCMKAFFPGNQCIPALGMGLFAPSDFAKSVPFSSRALPPPTPGTQWTLARGLNDAGPKSYQRYVETPLCLHPSQLNRSLVFPVMVYTQGLNSHFQAEWRSVYRPGEVNLSFNVRGGKGVAQLSSSEVGIVEAPICESLAVRLGTSI